MDEDEQVFEGEEKNWGVGLTLDIHLRKNQEEAQENEGGQPRSVHGAILK